MKGAPMGRAVLILAIMAGAQLGAGYVVMAPIVEILEEGLGDLARALEVLR